MLEEYMLPLRKQFDDGFGATADGFRDAAKALSDSHGQGIGLARTKLPMYYLNRHAIELFLKGCIIILHRRFDPDFPNFDRDAYPTIPVGNGVRTLFQVHDLSFLYAKFRSQIEENAEDIRRIAISDWTSIPPELDEWIALINAADARSTMFRYPITNDELRDNEKSSFKQVSPVDVAARMQDGSAVPQFVIFFKNDNNEVVDTYVHDSHPIANVAEALDKCAELLSGMNFGLLADLVYRVGHSTEENTAAEPN